MDENEFISFDDLKNKILSDPEAKKTYDDLEERFEIISAFIEIRNKLNLTQRELADITGIKQPSIARFETGQVKNISIKYINKLIKPLGYKTKVSFEKI